MVEIASSLEYMSKIGNFGLFPFWAISHPAGGEDDGELRVTPPRFDLKQEGR